jgi:hypothetical protein
VVELGTASSQPSSCCESCLPLSVYHEPAWLGLRVTMLSFELRNSEDMRLNGEMVGCCVDDGMGSWWGSFHSGVKSLMSCNRRNLRSVATSNILTHVEGNNSGTEHYSNHCPFRVLVAFPKTSRSAFTASSTPFSSVNLSLRPRFLGYMTSSSVKLREASPFGALSGATLKRYQIFGVGGYILGGQSSKPSLLSFHCIKRVPSLAVQASAILMMFFYESGYSLLFKQSVLPVL